MTRRPGFRSACLAALSALAVGCTQGQVRSPQPVAPTGPPGALVYEVTGEAALPLAVGLAARETSPAILPVSFVDSTEAGSETDDRKAPAATTLQPVRGRLEIREHGRTILARLSLYDRAPPAVRRPVADSRPGAASRRPDSSEPSPPPQRAAIPAAVYELELPAAELSLILDELARAGAYSEQVRPDGGAALSLHGPDGPVTKEWTPEPRLDDLAERVLREGRQVPRRLPGKAGTARVTVPPPAA